MSYDFKDKNLDFFQIKDLLHQIDQISTENPHEALKSLIEISKTQNNIIWELSGLSENIIDVYIHITNNLSDNEIKTSWDMFPSCFQQMYLKNAKTILQTHPNLAQFLFNKTIKENKSSDEETNISTISIISNILSLTDLQTTYSLIEQSLSENSEIKSLVMGSFEKLYYLRPKLASYIEEKIWDFKPQKAEEFTILYKNLAAFVEMDVDKSDRCLKLIDKYILDSRLNTESLNAAYHTLGIIRNLETDKSKVDQIFYKGLQSPANNKLSKKNAYRLMGKIEELYSSATLGERVEKSADNPLGWRTVESISKDEVCILALGGNGTTTEKSANGYLKAIENFVIQNGFEGKVKFYASVYDFGEFEDKEFIFNDDTARRKLMEDYKRGVRKSKIPALAMWAEQEYQRAKKLEDNIHPRYVKQIFEHAILPRITDKQGKRLSADEASSKIRKLNIVAHCHGAYTFLKLEELMQQKMTELGYTAQEKESIQKELLCITRNPYAPLGVSKSTMIAFCSAFGDEINHRNNFQVQIQHLALNNQLPLSYFPDRLGNMFICARMGEDLHLIDEHNYVLYDTTQEGLTKDGKALVLLEGNALISGIQSSIEGKKLPDIQTLVCRSDSQSELIYKNAKENGEKIFHQITQALRAKKMFCLE